jgi:hypothetical protein
MRKLLLAAALLGVSAAHANEILTQGQFACPLGVGQVQALNMKIARGDFATTEQAFAFAREMHCVYLAAGTVVTSVDETYQDGPFSLACVRVEDDPLRCYWLLWE